MITMTLRHPSQVIDRARVSTRLDACARPVARVTFATQAARLRGTGLGMCATTEHTTDPANGTGFWTIKPSARHLVTRTT